MLFKKPKFENCKEIQYSFKAYLEKKMSLTEETAFVKHIRNCPQCKGELIEYFGFLAAVKYLDASINDDDDVSKGNFAESIEKKLCHTELLARKDLNSKIFRRAVLTFVVFIISLAAGII
ncbi:MAG: zf-HC2 domain-containing protein [Lachnospiraceae bacterium]|nr:zf-HC2 domain-containing protein [Lachnospiraceae bacterium]